MLMTWLGSTDPWAVGLVLAALSVGLLVFAVRRHRADVTLVALENVEKRVVARLVWDERAWRRFRNAQARAELANDLMIHSMCGTVSVLCFLGSCFSDENSFRSWDGSSSRPS
jgi:hypothetical protein